MSTKIGQFEILSELAKSPTGTVYKANDPESGQTVALKAIDLRAYGEGAVPLEAALLTEAESTKVLSSPNITNVYGAGEIDGQFCAAMEYIQGNSIATMLTRKEGFSIWDLLDIGRQLCSGLEHAASQGIVHYSLEPAKIMCGWDGTVKILGFGVSSVGKFVEYVSEGIPAIMHYMSPEQIRNETADCRSNIFSLGAMFYEMVTDRKAFDRDDMESLRQSILESTPVAPIHVNPKVHPLLSDLIMKALAKHPAERYQIGRELLDDLEKCKESKAAAAVGSKPQAPAVQAKVDHAPQQPKTTAVKASAAPAHSVQATSAVAATPVKPAPVMNKPAAPARNEQVPSAPVAKPTAPKAAAAAVGMGSGSAGSVHSDLQSFDVPHQSAKFSAKAAMETIEESLPSMSCAAAEAPAMEPTVRQIPVDPTMSEGNAAASRGVSFSEMTELPPLKEAYMAPPPAPAQPEQVAALPTAYHGDSKTEEKPKIQPREVAEKAIKEIKSVPPRLMLYAIGGAAVLIVAIAIGFKIYVHSLNSDDDSGPRRTPVTESAASQPAAATPQNPQVAPVPAPVEAQPVEVEQTPARGVHAAATGKARNSKKKALAPASAPVVIPGQLAIDSTPQGAQVQLDGKSDPSWVTPLALTNLEPGQHTVTISKAGYSNDTRTIEVTSGNRATSVFHLTLLMATLAVKSEPAGASVYVDGRDVGVKTPAQVSVDKGQHVVLVRMQGYLDETTNAQFAVGQTFNFSPALRPLGNVDNIKTVGKMSKLFGGKGQTGQATVSIRTQPKGAQIAINQHLLDKGSPVDIALDPGNYEVDVTLSGYAPVHRVITATKGGKVVVDEVMQRQ